MFTVGAFALLQLIADPLPKIEAKPLQVRIVITDLSWQKLSTEERDLKLTVSVDTKDTEKSIPILGVWKFEKEAAIFEPRFPFETGIRYRIRLDKIDLAFELPAKKVVPAIVTAIYPTSNKLPENLLRLYIHFDRPMKPGNAFENLKLLDGDGKLIEKPFLELNEELWSPDAKRFTLFLDPGRVKQELRPREELGPVLEAGRKYTLVIGKEWKTADGSTLKAESRKEFTTVVANDLALDEKSWKLTSPAPKTYQPIVIQFDRSLDRALLERVIAIEDGAGKAIEGEIKIGVEETNWSFVPKQPWIAGKFTIVIRDVLEDVCGNRLGMAFETHLDEPRKDSRQPTRIPFEIK